MPPRKKKAAASSRGLDAKEIASSDRPKEIDALAKAVADDGGEVLAVYREPLAGHWTLFCALPIDKVEPTPFQRELSDTHVKRLGSVIEKVGRFFDPIIATRHDGGYWSPNGMHRLVAMKRLGAKSIVALVAPDPEIAYRILALNTEKAHNLKDKSLEVIRMARALAAEPDTGKKPESDYAFEFEEAAYPTIGICYEERPRFSGGAYMPVVKRCESFADVALSKSLPKREARAKRLLELDDEVAKVVEKLKEAGLKSPYLKTFVIARTNPLRFQKQAKPGAKAPSADLEATIDKMIASAKKIDASKVRPQDLASMAGAPPAEGE